MQRKNIQAVLCYMKKNGKTLMLHRNKKENDVHKGKWNGLGGKIEPGEMPEEALEREVFEESGLKIDARKAHFHGMICFPEFTSRVDWYVYIYVSRDFQGELIPSCSEGDLAWIDDEAVLALNLWDGDRLFLPWIEAGRFFSAKMIYSSAKLAEHSVYFY